MNQDLSQGIELHRAQRSAEAIPFLERATQGDDPTSRATALNHLGAAQFAAGHFEDAIARLNELFPEEENPAGFIPNNNDITSILNRLLPDEESSSDRIPVRGTGQSSGRLSAVPVNGFSVFLAKIGDEQRRQKAVPLLAELARISTEEAEALSKKVIIPVLKGVTKDEAESAKQRFAKIGILARVKGGAETQG